MIMNMKMWRMSKNEEKDEEENDVGGTYHQRPTIPPPHHIIIIISSFLILNYQYEYEYEELEEEEEEDEGELRVFPPSFSSFLLFLPHHIHNHQYEYDEYDEYDYSNHHTPFPKEGKGGEVVGGDLEGPPIDHHHHNNNYDHHIMMIMVMKGRGNPQTPSLKTPQKKSPSLEASSLPFLPSYLMREGKGREEASKEGLFFWPNSQIFDFFEILLAQKKKIGQKFTSCGIFPKFCSNSNFITNF